MEAITRRAKGKVDIGFIKGNKIFTEQNPYVHTFLSFVMRQLGGTSSRIHKARKKGYTSDSTHTALGFFFFKLRFLPCGNKTLSKSELVIPAFDCQQQQASGLYTAQLLVYLIK